MPHVSQKRVKRKTAKLLEERFVRFILGLKNSKQGELLLKEILTPTERTMLAKRVSIIYMLERGYSFYRIQKILKVSTSTILRFWKQKQSGAFVHTLQSFKKEQEAKKFWGTLETFLRAGMPPRGRGRWRWFYEMKETHDKTMRKKIN